MRLGIIGLPQSGKTTIFNALTRGNAPTTMSGGRFYVHTAVVDVPDERLDGLAAMFKPPKTVYAKVTYADIAGLEVSGALLNQLAQMDGFVHVVRCFQDAIIPHPSGSIDPLRDVVAMDAELLLNDMIAAERKLERLADERRKGGGRDRAVIEREMLLFEKLHAALGEEKPLRDIDLSADEEKSIAGFGLLTRKPVLILLNLSEGQAQPELEYPHRKITVASIQGRLEMELVQLASEDAEIFMREYGIEELGLQRVIRLSYDLLGLQSFFTIGDDEVRAWTIRRGDNALTAAGIVHTDLQRGFIRAEVVAYADLVALGGLSEARQKGKLRLEGKEYILQDGEVMQVRFNV